jgi:hypothetical protein
MNNSRCVVIEFEPGSSVREEEIDEIDYAARDSSLLEVVDKFGCDRVRESSFDI